MSITRVLITPLLAFSSTTSNIIANWSDTLSLAETTPTCQVVVEPSLWPDSQVRDLQLSYLADLGKEATPVFFQSWYVYPHSGVAELEPGIWNFSEITPLIRDILNSTAGRELALQFGTVPRWMLRGQSEQTLPGYGRKQWNQTIVWDYNGKFETPNAFINLTEVAQYYANFMRYYTDGGFVCPKTGQFFKGFNYSIPWFEFGNEMEYGQDPRSFTSQFDRVASAVRDVDPRIKFLGLGLSQNNYGTPSTNFSFFEYFLNRSNHQKTAPEAQAIDYHYYASPKSRADISSYVTLFDQADEFLKKVSYIESIRKRMSPKTKTFLKELEIIAPEDNKLDPENLPSLFWSASGAYFAYLYAKLAVLKIEVVSMSQLVGGNPTSCKLTNGTTCGGQGVPGCVCQGSNFPSVTMLIGGRPTARWFTLKMLVVAFGSRKKRLIRTNVRKNPDVFAQGFEVWGRGGYPARKLLVVNKNIHEAVVSIDKTIFRSFVGISGKDPWAYPICQPVDASGKLILHSFAVVILVENCNASHWPA